MKHAAQTHRLAIAALFAAAAAPSHLVFAQEMPPPARPDPLATERPVTLPPATSPIVTTPTTTTPTTPQLEPAPLPKAMTPSPPPATEAASPTRQTTTRTTTTARTRSPADRAVPARAASSPVQAAAEAPAPSEPAVAPAAEPAPAPQAALPVPPAEPSANRNLLWLIGAGLLALLAAVAAFALLRRRRRVRDEIDERSFEAEPVSAETPVEPVPASAFAPAAAIPLSDRSAAAREAAIEPAHISVADADPNDVEILAASSDPKPGRPWLEFFLRPLRAGTEDGAALVEFALTVGNTGSEPARDVRVSAFMFPSGSTAESEMERMLIEPAAGEAKLALEAGAAARVEGSARLPREALADEVLPVVVADARYRLPDGSEGVMRAAFEIGRAEGGSPAPFPVDDATGLTDDLAARLHGEVERV